MSVATHSKSRRGCINCKRRKVKCGEEQPSCQNCRRRHQECTYAPFILLKSFTPARTPTSYRTNTPSPARSLSASRVDRPEAGWRRRPGWRSEDHAFELRLMHLFTMSTSRSWTPTVELWMSAAPQFAFQYEFLLDALLATASMHWGVLYPSDRRRAASASAAYYARAVQHHTRALNHFAQHEPTFESSMAVLLTTSIITFYSLAQLGTIGSECSSPGPSQVATTTNTTTPPTNLSITVPNRWEDDDGTAFFQWISLARGIRAVYRNGRSYFDGSTLMERVRWHSQDIYLDAVAFAPTSYAPLLSLRGWEMEETPLSLGDIQVYENAINYIGTICLASASKECPVVITRRIVTMIPRCGWEFCKFLDERRPRALVILAHAFAALRLVECDLWWVVGIADRVLKVIDATIPPAWRLLMPCLPQPIAEEA